MGELVDPADSKSAAERRTSSSLVAGTIAGMVELVDTADLKSAALLGVRVRAPFPAPRLLGDVMGNLIWMFCAVIIGTLVGQFGFDGYALIGAGLGFIAGILGLVFVHAPSANSL